MIPGPQIVEIVAHALKSGYRRAAWAAAGMVLGDVLYLATILAGSRRMTTNTRKKSSASAVRSRAMAITGTDRRVPPHFVNSCLDELILHFPFAERGEVEGLDDRFPRYNGYPKEVYPIIIRDGAQKPDGLASTFAMAVWDFTPSWMKPPQYRPSVNVPCEGMLRMPGLDPPIGRADVWFLSTVFSNGTLEGRTERRSHTPSPLRSGRHF